MLCQPKNIKNQARIDSRHDQQQILNPILGNTDDKSLYIPCKVIAEYRHQNTYQKIEQFVFHKYKTEPIIHPADVPKSRLRFTSPSFLSAAETSATNRHPGY